MIYKAVTAQQLTHATALEPGVLLAIQIATSAVTGAETVMKTAAPATVLTRLQYGQKSLAAARSLRHRMDRA